MTGNKKINFNAGPAAIPGEVLRQASEAIIDYNGSGLSILSIPHRGKLFVDIMEEAQALVKELCGLGDDYEVLWLHGGGRLQFCMVPMNFLNDGAKAAYIDSGHWAADAIDYAKYYGDVNVVASSREDNYKHLPEWPGNVSADNAYLHFTSNNTIYGTQWKTIPHCDVPLIADMSSDIFSLQRDYTKLDLFYAVAQKNMGPAGATIVAIKKDMLAKAKTDLPPMLSYIAHAKARSLLNTPPVFAIYVSLLYLRWTKAKTIAAIESENKQKAEALYNEIERNTLFNTDIKQSDRSMMNVCFGAAKKEHETTFLNYCAANNIVGIEGHRSVGAFRVSLYNAISLADVQRLVAAMQQFETENQNS